MTNEAHLRDKLRKIEALFAGAATPGERQAAGAAADRIKAQLETAARVEPVTEMRYSIADPWSRRLFIAMCRRYGLRPFRYARMKRQTLVVKGPETFLDRVLWPEFLQVSAALSAYLDEVTDRIIREEVHGEGGEADEVAEPAQIGRN